MAQTLNTKSFDTSLEIANNLTSGYVEVGSNITTGYIDIGTNPSRAGHIFIGDNVSTGEIRLRTTGVVTIGGPGSNCEIGNTAAILQLGSDTTSGQIGIGQNQTDAGAHIYMGTNTSRTGPIVIGNPSNSGTISIQTAGNINVGDHSSSLSLGNTTTTGNVLIGNGQDTGTISMGTNASRTGAINIGNATNSGPISIRTTDVLTLSGSNYSKGSWTPVLYDQSLTDTATIVSVSADYIRQGDMVFIRGKFTLTSKGTLTGTEAVLIGGLPFARGTTYSVNGAMSGQIMHGGPFTQVLASTNFGAGYESTIGFVGTNPPSSFYNNLTWNNLAATGLCAFSMMYIVP